MNHIAFATTHANLAKQASKLCFLQPSVILAQWIDEGGQYNNLANIRSYGDMNHSGGATAIHNKYYLTTNLGGFYEYSTPYAGMLAYADFMNQNSNYSKCEHLATWEETCNALSNSKWSSGGYGNILHEIIVGQKLTRYDGGYNNIAGNPNVKPTQSSTAIGTATPTSYIKRPQTFHKGLTPPVPVHSPSSIPIAKKKITSSAGSLAKGTKNNIDEPERTLKIASLSFVGIVAILFFIGHAFIPTETL